MNRFCEIIVSLFFCCWLLATILNQFEFRLTMRLRDVDVFHLLPRWTFFAPNPGTSDYHFIYRKMDNDSQLSPFEEVRLHSKITFITAFWNSRKRVQKAFSDLVGNLMTIQALDENRRKNIRISFCYIALLNFISSIPRENSTKSVQFAILKTDGFFDSGIPQIIFISEFHDV